jgi:sugar lactone lactonase YvrE
VIAQTVCGNFQFLEGPVWVPARKELLFSDIPASRIQRYSPATNSFSVFREPSGQANGNTLDPQGRLVTCEHGNRRVSRTEADGKVVALAAHYEGKRLNSPNDVVCKRDGSVYFSDPPYGVKPELRELDFQGVYRIAPTPSPSKEGSSTYDVAAAQRGPTKSARSEKGSSAPVPLLRRGQGWVPPVQLLVKDFVKPNGLAFSPDEKILYIADTELGHIRAFDVKADGTLTNSRVFCQVERPDGFRVDAEGSLYVSAMKSVEIFDRTGKKRGEIALPERPANLAFGDPDRKTLYICARTSLYKMRVTIPGAPTP